MKKEKIKREKRLNAFITAIETILLLVLILSYLTQFIIYSSRTIMYFTNKDKYNSYTEIFYDKSFKGETDEDNFEYLYNLTTNYDRDLIKSGAVLESEVTIFAWTELLIKGLSVITIILLCEVIRRLTLEDNLSEKNKRAFGYIKNTLAISFIVLFIANLIIALATPFETNFLSSLLIYIILYSLIQLISFFVEQNKVINSKNLAKKN